MDRPAITQTLLAAANSYWTHKRYSCFTEIAVNRWGKLRADLISLKMDGTVVLSEIKSCKSDYLTDNKWRSYLSFCDRFYFVMSLKTFRLLKTQLAVDLKGTGAGVMVLDPNTGYLKSVVPARLQDLQGDTRWSLVIRMAWRTGVSRRTVRRRTRHFLND